MRSVEVGKFIINDITDHRVHEKTNLCPSEEKLGIKGNFTIWQDNDRKHKALNTSLWLLYNTPKCIETSLQSPDMNPTELSWDHLKRQIKNIQKLSCKKNETELMEQL